MKRIFELIFVITFFYFAWNNVTYHVPDELELEHVTGKLVSVREAVDDDPDEYEDHYIVLEVAKGGISRNIVSYDKSLLSKLETSIKIDVGIYTNRNVSELWSLNQGDLNVTIRDTDKLRWTLIQNRVYIFGLFFIFFVVAVIFDERRS